MLRAQDTLTVPDSALRSAMGWAQWPARLQKLAAGPLAKALPAGSELVVDGGHNPAAGKAMAAHFAGEGQPVHIIMGMLPSKDHAGFIRSFPRGTRFTMVPIPGHSHEPVEHLATLALASGMKADRADSLLEALARVEAPSRVLIGGSLHLAGEALKQNGTVPQ